MSQPYLSVWAPPRFRTLVRRPAESLPYPLGEPGCRLHEWGRSSLWHGLAAVGLQQGDEVLVPAYHHGSEVATLADRGLVCRFYEATGDLEPDPAELELLCGPRTRALYLIHPLGFALDAPRWRRWCDERGLLLIADVAMSWLAYRDGLPLGSWGDLSIFSPWKTYGLPDCGALLCPGTSPPPQLPTRRGLRAGFIGRGLARGLAQRHGWIARAGRRGAGSEWDPAAEFSITEPSNGPSAASIYLLRRAADRDVAAERRAHHARLVERLGSLIAPPVDRPQEGSCPFGVPIRTANKATLLDQLLSRGIAAIDFWAVPHPLLPVDDFPAAARRRATTVLLPVHQELSKDHVEYIGDTVLELMREEMT